MNSYVLRSVLDHRHISPGQLLWYFCTIFIRVWLFHFLEYLLQKLSLLILLLLNLNLLFDFRNLLFNLLCFLFFILLSTSHHLLTILSNHMIVESTIWVIPLQECKLRFIGLHLHECFFKLQSILCYIIGCLIDCLLYCAWWHDYTVHLLYIIDKISTSTFLYF